MVERLRLKLNGASPIFKLSKPGVDVNTAVGNDLLFDISQGVYSGIFMSGYVPFSTSTWTLTTAANSFGWASYYRYVIPFGKTFSSLPKIGLSINDAILGAGWYGPQYNPGQTSGSTGCVVAVIAETGLDQIVLMVQRIYFTGTQWPFPNGVSYVVYHG